VPPTETEKDMDLSHEEELPIGCDGPATIAIDGMVM
jgi:hypothetical protein